MRHTQKLLTRRGVRAAVVAATVVIASGCDGVTGGPKVPEPESLALFLSGAAANQLQPDGTLLIANVPVAGSRPQISEVQARQLAAAFIATHLAGFRPVLERDRGASIDITGITVCPRVFYAESPTEELPDEMPAMYHRLYGPKWLTTLCTPSGEAVIALSISAYATELRVENGTLWYPMRHGEEFRIVGIPPGEENQLPLSPEVAVRNAARLANRRIAAIPRLILRSPPTSAYPQLAQWQLSLDGEAEVQIERKPERAKVGELFIGGQYREKLKVKRAAREQPDDIEASWLPEDAASQLRQGVIPQWRTSRVTRRRGIPITFEVVDRVGGS